MAKIYYFPAIIEKKIEKTEKKIEDVILDSERIVEQTINHLCVNIYYGDEDGEYDDYAEWLKDLRSSINDWFDIQKKKKERKIL